jgi:enoyl-CoA hydratase/carnithine racemase
VPAPVLVEREPLSDGYLAVVRLHRPEARNAMDTSLLAVLADALDDAARDGDLRGLLLTGSGEHFSAGADVRETTDDGGRRRMELFTLVYELLTDLPVPTAAAVEGYAVGGGAEAAAACDLRAAGEGRASASRAPGTASRSGWPDGRSRGARDGQGLGPVDARRHRVRGARRGFVQRLTATGGAEDAARAWLTEVAARDPGTVRLLKRLFNDAAGGLSDRVAYENDALRSQAETGRLPDLDRDLPRTVRPRRR